MIITIANLISIGFTLGILIHVIITNNYLGNKIKSNYLKLINIRFIYLFLILFIIFMIVLTVLNLFDITLFNIINENNFNNDRSLKVFEGIADNNSNSQGSNNTTNVTMAGEINAAKDSVNVAEGSVNINIANINLSIPMPAINKMVAAGSTMGAVRVGIKVAKNFGGRPAIKLGLGLGTMAVTHTAAYMMSNLYNATDKSNNESNNNDKKMIIIMIKKIKAIKIKIITQIMKTIKQIKVKLMVKNILKKIEFKSAFLLPFILKNVGSDIKENSEPIVNYVFSMITLNLVVLFCFVNVLGYVLSLYLINKYDIEVKFPKFKYFINYFKKSREIFIIIECVAGFLFLIFIIILNIIFLSILIQ